jgi:uncharacterized protein
VCHFSHAARGRRSDWNGVLDAGAQGKLHIVVHVLQNKNGSLTGTIDSPDQGARGIPVTSITYKTRKLHLECASIGGSYDGNMSSDKSQITGTWSQGGASLPLNLTRSK